MTNIVNAALGTRLIRGSASSFWLPVVAWADLLANGSMLPVTPGKGSRQLLTGDGVLFPGGEVLDLTTMQVWPCQEDWDAADPDYSTGEPLFVMPDKPITESCADKRGAPWGISFEGKPYKLASSWFFSDSETGEEFVFRVDGGLASPDDARCTKVNREDFTKLALKVPVRELEEVLSGPSEAEEEEEEEQHPEDGGSDAYDAALALV